MIVISIDFFDFEVIVNEVKNNLSKNLVNFNETFLEKNEKKVQINY